MIIVNDFHELYLPNSDSGHEDGTRKDFCTCDKDASRTYYLLNHGRLVLGDLMSNLRTKEFYFKTILECHQQASAYYRYHKEKYPYDIEWNAAIAAEKIYGGVAKAPAAANVDSQQHMVFE